jgi:predicted nucleotidyltransferase
MKLAKHVLNHLVALLEADDRIASAYLLGSAARGQMRSDSDIDIALLPFRGVLMSSVALAELAGKLSYEAGRQVDLGLLSSANLIYARQVLGSRRRLFTKESFYVDLMETSLISMYLWFNEECKELIHAYKH